MVLLCTIQILESRFQFLYIVPRTVVIDMVIAVFRRSAFLENASVFFYILERKITQITNQLIQAILFSITNFMVVISGISVRTGAFCINWLLNSFVPIKFAISKRKRANHLRPHMGLPTYLKDVAPITAWDVACPVRTAWNRSATCRAQ